jgi:hypothetical protein
MTRTTFAGAALVFGLTTASIGALAASDTAVKEMGACPNFVDYGGGTILQGGFDVCRRATEGGRK